VIITMYDQGELFRFTCGAAQGRSPREWRSRLLDGEFSRAEAERRISAPEE